MKTYKSKPELLIEVSAESLWMWLKWTSPNNFSMLVCESHRKNKSHGQPLREVVGEQSKNRCWNSSGYIFNRVRKLLLWCGCTAVWVASMHEERQTDRCICKDIEKQCLIKYISFSYIIILLSENAFVLTIHEESNTIIFFFQNNLCATLLGPWLTKYWPTKMVIRKEAQDCMHFRLRN